MKKHQYIILFSIISFFTSCALKPITSEYTFIKTDLEKVEMDKLGNGTILIYNGADILHKIDNTARLNIWIGNKALGQIRPREYVIINLKDGNYEFKALHIDVVKMRSTHDVKIDSNTKVIKIKPNLTSNRLTVTNEFPKKFEKYKYAEKR
ncbi:hypothetical protein [Tenacibaculum retecalamus]|uniref:hypothetical protein n=1 Tax=Tenacibaculum retecalamus TaxID=3018315 RepID=UPI0023D8E6FE|nr:hypothetical protein [Tenacibaculum retecalamus]WBX70364.1 hypothetical protein PG912_08745 [Tenacibaculum retecalamus]